MQILRTSNSIATAEQLADLILDKSVPRFHELDERTRRGWLGDQINALNYMTHSSRIISEIDLVVEASMLDQEIMDNNVRWLTQVEMQEAFRKGIMREYGDFYGITASSLMGFLRGFMEGRKRQEAKSIIQMRELRREMEGQDRLKEEIERAKASGEFVPTWGPGHTFKKEAEDSAAHREKIRKQAEQIYKSQ